MTNNNKVNNTPPDNNEANLGQSVGVISKPQELKDLSETKISEEINKIREKAREKVAFMLVFGFLALLISTLLVTGTVDDAIKLIQTISSALSGMVGAVLGYYYGSTGLEKTTNSNTE